MSWEKYLCTVPLAGNKMHFIFSSRDSPRLRCVDFTQFLSRILKLHILVLFGAQKVNCLFVICSAYIPRKLLKLFAKLNVIIGVPDPGIRNPELWIRIIPGHLCSLLKKCCQIGSISFKFILTLFLKFLWTSIKVVKSSIFLTDPDPWIRNSV